MQKEQDVQHVGIDVSKADLVVHVLPRDKTRNFKNTPEGIDRLVRMLRNKPVQRVVLEASGAYEAPAAAALYHAGLAVEVVNPKQARDLAKALGKLSKTDRVDAKVLAFFAQIIEHEPRYRPDPDRESLQDLTRRRKDLVDLHTAEKNRLHQARTVEVMASIESVLTLIEQQLRDINKQIMNRIQETQEWHDLSKILKSSPGIGPVISTALIASMPELGTLKRKPISSLMGVAPHAHDSGTLRGKRYIQGGRRDLRRLLYQGTLAAVRGNNPFADFYNRLIREGKAHKVALVATMRKQITVLNAMVRDNKPFDPKMVAPST